MPNEFSPSDVLLQEKIAQLEKRAAEHEQKNEPEKAKEFRDKANELRSRLKQRPDQQRQKADEERQQAAKKIQIQKQFDVAGHSILTDMKARENAARQKEEVAQKKNDGTKERLQIEKDHNHKIETKKFADVSKEAMEATKSVLEARQEAARQKTLEEQQMIQPPSTQRTR